MGRKTKIAVLMGGKSPEYKVSLISGKEVCKNLSKEKYEVLPVLISKDGKKFFLDRKKEVSLFDLSYTADIIFIALHGPGGEDGTIQSILDFLGIPYTGSGVLASAIGMNKPIFRKIITQIGLPSPKFFLLDSQNTNFYTLSKNLFDFPLVIKPSDQGSSLGVSIVTKPNQVNIALKKAFRLSSKIMIEEYIQGIEVTCAILGNANPQPLPLVEIVPKRKFFDYQAKYNPSLSLEIVPARISSVLAKKVQEAALTAYKAIGCQGFGRVDIIIKDQTPYILEINTIPGLTPNSLFPKAAAAAGISYQQLLDILIKLALEKNDKFQKNLPLDSKKIS